MPNLPETVVAFLAANAIGAVFSLDVEPTSAPAGVVDRFGQIEPTVLFAADGYLYGGKRFDCLGRLRRDRGPRCPPSAQVVVVGNLADEPDLRGVPGARSFADVHRRRRPADRRLRAAALRPPRLHPLLVGHDRRGRSASSTGPAACC